MINPRGVHSSVVVGGKRMQSELANLPLDPINMSRQGAVEEIESADQLVERQPINTLEPGPWLIPYAHTLC